MPADLIDMPEFDENDPDMKAWMDGELERQRKFFAGTTHEEAMAAVDKIIAENGGTLEPKP